MSMINNGHLEALHGGKKKGRKKRFWSDEEKRSICEQTLRSWRVGRAGGAAVPSMNANLIFTLAAGPALCAVGPKRK